MSSRCAIGCAVLLGLASAWAQEAPPEAETVPIAPVTPDAPAPPTKPAGRVAFGEIVVTAQKREENIQDVPIAISAFSGDELDAKGIDDAQTLQTITPGLVYDSIGNFSVIYLRGVGTDAFIPSADLSVATYIDGVYFPFSYSLARSLGDTERLEVLKGPQGTLFGRNTTGGAINITTRDPAPAFKVSLDATGARFSQHDFKVSLSGPLLGETLGGVLSAIYNEKEEYYEYVEESTQQDFQPYRDKGAAGKLRWVPTEWFDATLGGFYIESQGPNTVMFKQLDPTTLGTALGVTRTEGDYKLANDAASLAWGRSWAEYLTLAFHPGPFDIKLIGSEQQLFGQEQADFDGSNASVAIFGGGDDVAFDHEIHDWDKGQRNQVYTAELQLLSNDESAGAEWVTWIVGLYYYDAWSSFDPVRLTAAGLDSIPDLSGSLPVPLDLSEIDPLLDLLNTAALPDLGIGFEVTGDLDTKSYAGFGQVTVSPAEWLDFTLGGRYTKEKRHVYNSHVDVLVQAPDGSIHTVPGLSYPEDRTQNSRFSPKAVLAVKPADGLMIYASWQEGFKSGSFNIVNLTTPPALIRKEITHTSEIGVKSDWFEGRVRANAAVFYTRIQDLQSQFLSVLSGGVVTFQNAQRATVKGLDIDTTWVITDSLILSVSANLLEGRYDEFTNARGYDPETRLYNPNNDFSGNTIVRNPEFTASVALNYGVAVPGGVLEMGADAYHNSGFFYDPGHTSEQDAYEVYNARIGYLFDPWNLRVTVFGDNLGNGDRYLFQFPNDFGTVGKLAPPRVYGVRVNWTFGG
ncbi:MAG TPA: TonB-dependent receptor [Nevskiaceae bacterium]|nr:TonB-dependent receptor [Nevskiaceae bacterium]